MARLLLDDLNASKNLDRKAMADVSGGQQAEGRTTGRTPADLIHEGLTNVGKGLGTAAGWLYCRFRGPNCGGAVR